jgi:hypothetical protein
MAKFIDPIPNVFQPPESDNVVYSETYRAIYDLSLPASSFLPFFLEHTEYMKKFTFEKQTADLYAMSVFNSEKALDAFLAKNSSLRKRTVGVAVGPTRIERGISTSAEPDGHLQYFLYDSTNNNPHNDYHLLKKIGADAK